MPVLPLAILLADFLAGVNSPLRSFHGPAKILAAMLIGVVAAGLTESRVDRPPRTGVLRRRGLCLSPRDLADRRGLDLRRGHPAERTDRRW